MKNLHNITPNLSTWSWFTLVNQFGRTVHGGIEHLYEVPRGLPPPLHENRRVWWTPYQAHSAQDPLAPLCGYRTRARYPNTYRSWGSRPCGHCNIIAHARGIIPTTPNSATLADPWMEIAYDQRATTPDPITGL